MKMVSIEMNTCLVLNKYGRDEERFDDVRTPYLTCVPVMLPCGPTGNHVHWSRDIVRRLCGLFYRL